MTRAFLAAVLLLAFFVADGTQTVLSQEPSPEAAALAYLAQTAPAAATSGLQQAQQRSAAPTASTDRGLEHVVTQESPGAYHVRFQETEAGVPIFGGSVVVNLDKDTNEVGLVTDRRSSAEVASSALSVDPDQALNIANGAVGVVELRDTPTQDLVYYPIDKQLFLAWQVQLPATDPLGDWLVVVRADNGQVVELTNLASMDSGRVFDPNPVATGGTQSVTNCDTGPNESVVDSEYVTRTLLGIDSGQNLLVGQYVDLTAPGIIGAYKSAGQASSASHTYTYDCNDDRFEEVMVYFHVDTTQRRLQALGFTGTSAILDEPIPAHAHYMSECNAFYSPVDTGLHFGDCSAGTTFVTDTAEDGDVIIHEYGHAIQDDQVPGWAFGSALTVEQARGMGEGFGDFLAATMTGSPCIGDWVSFGNTSCAGNPGLRYLQNSKTYPASFEACRPGAGQPAEEHCTGEIWGAALWDFVEALGGDQDAIDLALRLVIDSHFYLDPQATFDDGVCAIFAADNDLFGGAHGATIANVFSNRGINCTAVPPPDFPYAFLRVRHTWRGDLTIHIKAGIDPDSPDCDVVIWDRDSSPADSTDDVVGFIDLTSTCNGFLPPSETTPWWLEVQDQSANDSGTIEDFEIVLSGTVRCISQDVPVAIPDGAPGAAVRAMVDCTGQSTPLTNGFLRVTTNPAVPSQIMVDGAPRDSWGLTWVKMLPGQYTVSFTGFEGLSAPSDQQVTITAGATTTVDGSFTQRGFLRVITNPAVPATILVDGIPRNDWGVWTDLDPGTYQVCYGEVADFTAPPCADAVVTAGNTTTLTGNYTASAGEPGPANFGMLRVETSPPVRSQILVDGEPMDTWGLTWVKLAPGSYTVSFGDVPEFSTPAPQTVTVSDGVTTTVIGNFQLMGLLQVATSPAVPATIFVDGVPRNDWGIWTAFPPGSYQVCYGEVDGYDPPPCQNATVSSGANTLVQGSFSVAAAPANPTVDWLWSGAVTTSDATVNAKLDAESDNVRLVVSQSQALDSAPVYSSIVSADVAQGNVASMPVSGLNEDTTYYYAVEVDGELPGAEGRGTFHTFPSGASSFTFVVGSCVQTGSNHVVFDTIRGFSPLFYLMSGDFHYENVAVNSQALFRTAFDTQLGQTRQEDLYQAVPIAYVWDDHDYGPNDGDGNSPSRTAARLTYREYVPHYSLPAGSGNAAIYQAFSVGRVRFILTDLRSERDVGGSGSMMGATQLAWFKSELAASAASHELVIWVSTVGWIATAAAGRDDWGGFSAERTEIADFIKAQGIDNLLVLSGDAHMVAIDDGANSDYATGGGAAFPLMHAAAVDQSGSTKGGPYSEGTFPGRGQFGLVTITDDGSSMDVTLSGRDSDGSELVSYSFTVPGA